MLIVPISQAHYLMGQDPLLLSFIVVIIGGLGSLRGTVVAALLIGLSDGIVSMFFSPTLAKGIAFARVPAGDLGQVTVDIRGRQVPVRVVKFPFVREGQAQPGVLADA